MTVHPLQNLALNDLNHKLVACKIHKPSNNITVSSSSSNTVQGSVS